MMYFILLKPVIGDKDGVVFDVILILSSAQDSGWIIDHIIKHFQLITEIISHKNT
jgi:hypothetical protein